MGLGGFTRRHKETGLAETAGQRGYQLFACRLSRGTDRGTEFTGAATGGWVVQILEAGGGQKVMNKGKWLMS